MKVLFVSSGNKVSGISPIVQRQGDSLERNGIEVHYFKVQGKGLKGYLRNIQPLRKLMKKLKPDITHAHYSLTGILATLAGVKPIVVSLMGSDAKSTGLTKWAVVLFSKYIWNQTIVKSRDMQLSMGLNHAHIIPNGIDLSLFRKMDKHQCRIRLGWDASKSHILFAADPSRPEKNFQLVQSSMKHINDFKLHTLSNINPDEIPIWMNAADLVILTSNREGSPNVIKEAMACSKPIVATEVGDIKWLLGNEPGHYLCKFDKDDVADKIKSALAFSKEHRCTNGRKRLIELGLDDNLIAQQLIDIYTKTIIKYD